MSAPIGETLGLDERKLPALVFERLDARSGLKRDWSAQREAAWDSFGKPGRDPATLGSVADVLASAGDWTPHLKIAQLNNHWDQVVGSAIAAHSSVAGFTDGILFIRTESQIWATQLTYLIPQLTAAIRQRLEGLDIKQIRVTGPRTQRTTRRWVR